MTSPREAKVLERRPKAASFTVEELVQEVLDGRVRVPKFQRDLRWDEGDVERLLDSIYRGYPVGTLLFWVRHGNAQRLEYGTVHVNAPDMSEAWWVVDGQQRLNALVRALAGVGHPTERFALYFDLQKECFVRPKPRHEIPEHWLPLTEVVDSERLMSWMLEHPEVNRSLAITVGKRIREYSVPAYLVTTTDEEAVSEIFARLNSTGRRMEPHEVFTALHGATRDASPGDVRDISKRLAELGFGELDPEVLHSMMLATRSVEISKDRVPQLEAEVARAALVTLENAARSVIVFFRETAEIPHVALLPYKLPLITLTRFFAFFPHAHPRNRELLSRWVWRGSISGDYQGNTISVRASLEAITENDEHGSVQRLLDMVAHDAALEAPLAHAALDGFRFHDARGKLLTLALWSLEPRHLETGDPLEIRNGEHPLFPPARIASGMRDGLLANRIIHPSDVGPTLRRYLLANQGSFSPETLASHALDAEMLAALADGDLSSFRQRREQRLAPAIAALYELRSQPHQSDRPPLEALIIGDDDPQDMHHGLGG